MPLSAGGFPGRVQAIAGGMEDRAEAVSDIPGPRPLAAHHPRHELSGASALLSSDGLSWSGRGPAKAHRGERRPCRKDRGSFTPRAPGGRGAPFQSRLGRPDIQEGWVDSMWWTMAIMLLALWALGLFSGATLGGWVHLFFALAAVCSLMGLMRGAPRAGDLR